MRGCNMFLLLQWHALKFINYRVAVRNWLYDHSLIIIIAVTISALTIIPYAFLIIARRATIVWFKSKPCLTLPWIIDRLTRANPQSKSEPYSWQLLTITSSLIHRPSHDSRLLPRIRHATPRQTTMHNEVHFNSASHVNRAPANHCPEVPFCAPLTIQRVLLMPCNVMSSKCKFIFCPGPIPHHHQSPPPAILVVSRRKVMFYYAHPPHYGHKRQRANQLLFDLLCLPAGRTQSGN